MGDAEKNVSSHFFSFGMINANFGTDKIKNIQASPDFHNTSL